MSEENATQENEQNEDVLAGHDEAELTELGEADAYGGTSAPCVTASIELSVAVCPTTACTSKC